MHSNISALKIWRHFRISTLEHWIVLWQGQCLKCSRLLFHLHRIPWHSSDQLPRLESQQLPHPFQFYLLLPDFNPLQLLEDKKFCELWAAMMFKSKDQVLNFPNSRDNPEFDLSGLVLSWIHDKPVKTTLIGQFR
jgi:hypothetical protein